jgi:hypothetical protein
MFVFAATDFVTALGTVSSLLAIILAIMTYFSEREKERLRHELHREKLFRQSIQDYARRTQKVDLEFVEAIVLGPRSSGKTSIVKLWTTPWTKLERKASLEWKSYDITVYQSEPETFHDELFEVHRPRARCLKLRVHDYPGEDEKLLEAIASLKRLNKKVMLIFVLKVGEERGGQLSTEDANANDAYFSRVFVEKINEHVKRVSAVVAHTFVVFGRSDLLSDMRNELMAVDKLKRASPHAVHNLETIFKGAMDYRLVSAHTNHGVVRLLGSVCQAAIDVGAEDAKSPLAKALRRLKREIEGRKS